MSPNNKRIVLSHLMLLVSVICLILAILLSYIIGGRAAVYTSPLYRFSDISDLTGKVAIITGSNTGIGYVTARELARRGARVIATARDEGRGQDAVSRMKKEILSSQRSSGIRMLEPQVEFMRLDLSSLWQVKEFAKEFLRRGLPVDILILNAGVVMPEFGYTSEGFELQIGTNHLGHFLLVKTLYQTLVSSKSRVVVVTSHGHRSSYPEGIRFDSFRSDKDYNKYLAYGQSKLANLLFSNELARRSNGTGLNSNAVHPGVIVTESSRHVERDLQKNPVMPYILPILKWLFNIFAMNVDDGALTQLYVATSPKLKGVTGKYFVPIATEDDPAPIASNVTLQKQLWDESERLVNSYIRV